MKKYIFLASIVLFQTMLLHGMDQASITKVSLQEFNAVLQEKAFDYARSNFGIYRASKLIDGHINSIEVDYDVLVREQVIPLLVQQRLFLAKEQGIEVPVDQLSKEIAANVLAVWNANKK